MRTLLPGEREISKASRVEHHLKVEIQDAGSTNWIDWTPYVEGARWGEANEPAVSQASVRLRREGGGTNSLAPLMKSSQLNVYNGIYAPAIDKGRRIRIKTATVAPGTQVTAGHYREGFLGRIDEISWESSPIVLSCSDEGAWLQDTQIKTEKQFGAPAGVPVQTVTQAILNEWKSGRGTADNPSPLVAPTLVYTDPGWSIKTYTQARDKVLDAVRALWLQIGWDLRYRYDAAHIFQLTAYDPDRDSTVVHATIGQGEYADVRRLSMSLGNIRNDGKVSFTLPNGQVGTAEHFEQASIDKHGRRYMELPPSKNIDSPTEANKFIQSVIHDLSDAGAEQEIETHFLWFVQLHDRYTFEANGVHYDEPQTWAVVGYEHSFETPATGKTTIRVAGRVVGAYDAWIRRTHIPRGRVPTIEPRLVLEPTLKNAADLYAKVFTETGEQTTLLFRESETVIWTLCVGPSDGTTRYVDSGTELGPSDWFTSGGTPVQKLDNIGLGQDQLTRCYLRAVCRDSDLASTWVPLPLDLRWQPSLESIDLVFKDDVNDQLVLTAIGGANCASVKLEITDDPSFATIDHTSNQALSPGGSVQTTLTLVAGDRNKTWYARATPYNGLLSGGAPSGLAGAAVRDTVFVPALVTPPVEVRFRTVVSQQSVVRFVADIFLRVKGVADNFPLTVNVWETDPTTPSGNLVADYVIGVPSPATNPVEIGPGTHANLNDRLLPINGGGRRYYAKIVDSAGNITWHFTAADNDSTPEGDVSIEDYSANPKLHVDYDEDTTHVRFTAPGPKVKTFSGLSGGGRQTFVVGASASGGTQFDDATFGTDLPADATTGNYKVEVGRNGSYRKIWEAPLHGRATKAPALDAKVSVVDNLQKANIEVTLSSPIGEQIGLRFKDSDNDAVTWTMCMSSSDSTPRYVNNPTTLPADGTWFHDGSGSLSTDFAEKLENIVLVRDRIIRRYLQAYGKDTGAVTPWIPITLEMKGQPWLESVDLVWDEVGDVLKFTAIGGANCQSARFIIRKGNPTSGTIFLDSTVALTDAALVGGTPTQTLQSSTITAANRNDIYYGSVEPFNGPSGTGLAGATNRDTEFVLQADTSGYLPLSGGAMAGKLDINTANGRLVLPVGADKWAT